MASEKALNIRYLFVLLLLGGILVDYSMNGCYIFFILLVDFILHISDFTKYVDRTFAAISSFSASYYLIALFNGSLPMGYSVIVYPIVVIPVLYLYGRWLGDMVEEEKIPRMLFLGALCVASVSLFSVAESIIQDGFTVDYRNVHWVGTAADSQFKAASAIGILLTVLASFVSVLLFKDKLSRKLLFFLGSGLALFCGLRVQSRTMILAVIITLLLYLIAYRKQLFIQSPNRLRNVFLLIVFIVGVVWLYSRFNEYLLVIDRFQNDDVSTGNGRTELLMSIFGQVLKHPFGGLGNEHYAHDLWVDVGRVSGWIPMAIMIILSVSFYKRVITICKSSNLADNTKYYFFTTFVALFIALAMEPIIEAAWTLFLFYCFNMGFVKSIHNNYVV